MKIVDVQTFADLRKMGLSALENAAVMSVLTYALADSEETAPQ